MIEIDRVLERREELYRDLLQYSRQQVNLSYLKEAAAFNGLIELKDQCLAELLKNETILKRLLQGEAEQGENDARARFDAWNQKIAPAAREIKDLDRQCRTKFSAEMQAVRNRLTTLTRGKKGIAGYKAANRIVGAAGAFTDKRS